MDGSPDSIPRTFISTVEVETIFLLRARRLAALNKPDLI